MQANGCLQANRGFHRAKIEEIVERKLFKTKGDKSDKSDKRLEVCGKWNVTFDESGHLIGIRGEESRERERKGASE